MIKSLRKTIFDWFEENKRSLPWRETKDPYLIWLSEIILQQTRVSQGMPYYQRFVENFPDVISLATAKEQEILRLWQGLGYYSRARNMHHAAKTIISEHDGKFPSDYETIKKLKGVGEYTASAISSIAFNKPFPVLDGNVIRVVSRIFGIETACNTTSGSKIFKDYAHKLLDKKKPGNFNQAIMEFGALQCLPKNPDCLNCPAKEFCMAYNNSLVDKLPLKIKKVKVRKRYFHYFLIENDKGIILRKREMDDIWKNLYELPLIETSKPDDNIGQLMKKNWGFNAQTFFLNNFEHKLTHQLINAYFYRVENKYLNNFLDKHFILVNFREIDKYPISRLTEKFFNEHLNN